jgi:YD repeat-containing protein
LQKSNPRAPVLAVLALVAAGAMSANAAPITYTYDALGRVTQILYPNGKAISYSYDAAGNRIQDSVHYITNQTPTAVADSISTMENTAVTFDPRTNDYDVDGDTLTISAAANGSHGTVGINGGGTSVTYTPTNGYSGSDSFSYTISDPGGATATTTVAVTVNHLGPTAVADNPTVTKEQSVTYDPRTNDTNPYNQTLTITAVSAPSHGTKSFTSSSITYTPTLGYAGPDSFTYTIQDPQGSTSTATENMTVQVGNNQNPVAVADTLSIKKTVSPSTQVTPTGTFDPRVNDSDPDNDPITISAVTNGTKGNVSFTATSVTYTYNTSVYPIFSDTDHFTYTISDGFGGHATATVTVKINILSNQ